MPEVIAGQSPKFRAVIVADGDQQTFALRRLPGLWTRVTAAMIIILFDIPGVVSVIGGTALLAPGREHDLAAGMGELLFGLVWLWPSVLFHFRQPLVSITPSELRARGSLGYTRRAQRSQVASIELRPHTYGRGPTALQVPYLRKTGGGGFWLDALAGDTYRRPADPAQLEVLSQLRAVLNVTGSEPLGRGAAR